MVQDFLGNEHYMADGRGRRLRLGQAFCTSQSQGNISFQRVLPISLTHLREGYASIDFGPLSQNEMETRVRQSVLQGVHYDELKQSIVHNGLFQRFAGARLLVRGNDSAEDFIVLPGNIQAPGPANLPQLVCHGLCVPHGRNMDNKAQLVSVLPGDNAHIAAVVLADGDFSDHHIAVAVAALLTAAGTVGASLLADFPVSRIGNRAATGKAAANPVDCVRIRVGAVVAIVHIGAVLIALRAVAVKEVAAAARQGVKRYDDGDFLVVPFHGGHLLQERHEKLLLLLRTFNIGRGAESPPKGVVLGFNPCHVLKRNPGVARIQILRLEIGGKIGVCRVCWNNIGFN